MARLRRRSRILEIFGRVHDPDDGDRGGGADDAAPTALAVDPSGNLYGTTGQNQNVFELTGIAPPPTLDFAQGPVSGLTTSPLGTLTVDIRNSSGALITTDDSNVTLSIAGGPAGATLTGTTTVAFALLAQPAC